MAWPWHNPTVRCAELNVMAHALWRRRCTSLFDQITFGFADGRYVAVRAGHSEQYKFDKYGEAEKWLRQFFDGLLYGSGAPDDIFLDALKGVGKKSHHKGCKSAQTKV